MLKVGLVGCGGMGVRHAKCWQALGDEVKLVAIADADENNKYTMEEAETSGARVYSSGEEMIEKEELDIVDVCSPTFLHTKHAVMAMEKGMNVLIEKPVCLNEEEAKLLLETEKRCGVKVEVGHVIRFWDEYVWLKDVIDKKTYGEMISASFQRLSRRPGWGWKDWFNNPDMSGTAVLDLQIHDVDFMRYIMGREPDDMVCRATRNKDGVLEHILSTFSYGDVLVSVEGEWDFPKQFPFNANYRVTFEDATVVFEKGEVTVYTNSGETILPEIPKFYDEIPESLINDPGLHPYYNEIKYFVEKILSGGKIEIAPLSEAVESARLVWKEIDAVGGKVKK